MRRRKTPDGQPDIQGFWNPIGTFYNIQDLEFQALYQNFAKEDPARRGKSLIIDPPDGKIPYQPWALEQVEAGARSTMPIRRRSSSIRTRAASCRACRAT